MRRSLILTLTFAFLAAPGMAQRAGPKPTLALVGGQIVDGYEGRPIPDGVVLIAGDRIAAVGATRWPAVWLKKEKEIGTLAQDHLADVIAVRGDVLTHIDLLQNVDVVVKNGVRVK